MLSAKKSLPRLDQLQAAMRWWNAKNLREQLEFQASHPGEDLRSGVEIARYWIKTFPEEVWDLQEKFDVGSNHELD